MRIEKYQDKMKKLSTFNPPAGGQLSTSQRGFTLIEFLAVIIVIGILAYGALIIIDPIGRRQRADDIRRKSDLAQIQRVMDKYYKDNGIYPLSTGEDTENPYRIKGFQPDHLVVDWGDEWLPYMSLVPKDPDSKKTYIYLASDNGQSYQIYASLNIETDADACKPTGSPCPSVPKGVTCGQIKDICNYGVSSPNVSP